MRKVILKYSDKIMITNSSINYLMQNVDNFVCVVFTKNPRKVKDSEQKRVIFVNPAETDPNRYAGLEHNNCVVIIEDEEVIDKISQDFIDAFLVGEYATLIKVESE